MTPEQDEYAGHETLAKAVDDANEYALAALDNYEDDSDVMCDVGVYKLVKVVRKSRTVKSETLEVKL